MTLAAGSRLGPYEILAPLGAGGMGEVYRGRDSRLEREVAVKVLPEHLAANPDALVRFEREAKAVAALSHPNILAIHDFGSEGGIAYAVTELLEGETLRRRLEGSVLGWTRAVEIAVAMAEGLAAAHSKGITHRDLKPENIFLTSDGRVKILDFGLARVATPAAGAHDAETMTEPGTVMGTPGYMSPEQVRGESARAPSDIFSLGCVLYEMIAGRRAFSRNTASETLSAILRDEPPEMAGSSRQVPAELQRAVTHCLEKNPGERFQSARDLAFALKAVSSSGAVPSPAPDKGIDSIAVLPFANLSRDPEADYLSDGLTESIMNSLARAPGLRVMPRSTVFRYKGKETDPQEAGRDLGVRAVLSGRVILRGETLVVSAELIDVTQQSQLWGERFNRKFADIFAIEEEIAGKISESLRGKLSGEEKKRLARRSTDDSEAYQLYLKGRHAFYKRTVGSLQQGLRYFQQAIERDPDYALAHSGICDSYALLSFVGVLRCRDAWVKCREAANRAVALDEDLAEAHASLAAVRACADWDWQSAGKEFRRAIELNPGYWQAHTWYAILALAPCGRHEEATAEIRKGLELEPLSPAVNHHAAMLFLASRRLDRAIECCRTALEFDPNFALAHVWRGMAYEGLGRFDEAIADLEKADQMFGESFPGSRAALAHALAAAGRRGEAERILEGLLRRAEDRYVDPFWLAYIHAGLGQADPAFHCLDRTLDDQGVTVIMLRYPGLDPLRQDPRFKKLLARLGLPET